MNLPENVNTFRIVGVVGDAKFAGFQLDRPARPMFFVPLAQTVNYASPLMQRVETASHYVGGILLVTDTPPGALEPQVARALAAADPNLTVINIRTLRRTGGTQLRSAARSRQPGRPLRHDRADTRRDRPLRSDGVFRGAPDQRDRHPHGARRRSRPRASAWCWAASFTRVAVGLAAGAAAGRRGWIPVSAQLYGVSFWDPVALSVAAGALAFAAFVASVVPASRAAALAPMIALRTE